MIGVIGLGYVGITSAICFHKLGQEILGIDVDNQKIKDLKKGIIHIKDDKLEKYFNKHYSEITFESDINKISDCSEILICVPTEGIDGSLDLRIVNQVLDKIDNLSSFNIWIRSTIDSPKVFNKLNSKSSNIFSFPEFLREGKCWDDFFDPPLLVLGGDNCERTLLYDILAKSIRKPDICNLHEAITIKIISNAFHALKVTFVNELSNIKWIDSIDLEKVMDIFTSDNKLNISSAYLKPGLPFGGPCLPKDTLALSSLIKRENDNGKNVNLFHSVIESNNFIHKKIADRISNFKSSGSIGFYGIEFKPNTGDIRNSPILKIIELINNDLKIFVFDDNIKSQNNHQGFQWLSSKEELFDICDLIITYKDISDAPNIIKWDKFFL